LIIINVKINDIYENNKKRKFFKIAKVKGRTAREGFCTAFAMYVCVCVCVTLFDVWQDQSL